MEGGGIRTLDGAGRVVGRPRVQDAGGSVSPPPYVHRKQAGVLKITCEEIIHHLFTFMESHRCKDINLENFLDFIAKQKAVSGREYLGVRIQNLWLHMTFIGEAKKIDNLTVKKCFSILKKRSVAKLKKKGISSDQKRKLDERFSAISQRFNSFSSVHEDFRGNHTIFVSSSSDDDDNDDYEREDKKDGKGVDNESKSPLQNGSSSDRVSSCPYPSANEEIMRLGLKVDIDNPPSASGSLSYNDENVSFSRKRQKSGNYSAKPEKILKKTKVTQFPEIENSADKNKLSNQGDPDLSIAHDSVSNFIATWKEACKELPAAEVVERMLQFYNVSARCRKRLMQMFASYPCIGLLNVAVMSIKRGMWDSIYDAFHDIDQKGINPAVSKIYSKYESIDVEASKQDAIVICKDGSEHTCNVAAEDIVSKLVTYFEIENDVLLHEKSALVKKCAFLRKLGNCEGWLAEQFSVKEFGSLGYGDFFIFMEKYATMLPDELYKLLMGEVFSSSPLEVSMLQCQLLVFLSQALSNMKENETLSKQKLSELLMRQFPVVSFKIQEYGSMNYLLDNVLEQESSTTSTSLLFSSALVGTRYSENFSAQNEEKWSGTEVRTGISQQAGILGHVTSKDAMDVLLKAPMLSDLISWSHWDLIFAPSLGPFVEWLLNEVNTKELLCLVTKEGKVIRIDNSATVDSLLEVSLQGSSFHTAVKLLSLFSLFGGSRHVPLALLKSHLCRAFEVFLKNSEDNMNTNDTQNFLMSVQHVIDEDAVSSKNLSQISKAVSLVSRFILDCLDFLPSEFRTFAADVLLSGLQSIIKNAPRAILCVCKQTERVMLHELGLSLGIMEWIDDYHVFHSSTVSDVPMPSCKSRLNSRSDESQVERLNTGVSERKVVTVGMDSLNEEYNQGYQGVYKAKVSSDGSSSGFRGHLSKDSGDKDASLVIESIRRDEFGLDPSLSNMESSMLKKQHARLGRALHCLSQELYSQDSHFLLELVQNADDNTYPENVEPTLTFVLQDEGIIVLNNERGFTAQNIRALCDVGNSTKKGSIAGYIGQKGIGFKSVFRVTDAPEIHSNGFHVKFDISEGQIGFVLPTLVPSCDVESFKQLVCDETEQVEEHSWNTCIILPFRSKLSGPAMNSIISMFSDLHPSLLLFLHRLQCIKFRNMLNGSLVVMRKEVIGDGIINVSHGKEKMTWFVMSQTLQAEFIRPDVKSTEISIAFTLKETDDGEYSPRLDQQPVFAFLPLRTYGLKFILQGDFTLPSSREEVDGNSPWNQWLLSEFPGLFVSALKSFCALSCFREHPGKAVAAYMSFVPLEREVHGFFDSLPRLILCKLCVSNCLLVEGNDSKWVPPCKVLRSWDMQARILLPDNLLHDHIGLGFLNRDIVLSDSLAKALGIKEYGPEILLEVMKSICCNENDLKSRGLDWLRSWLSTLYTMLSQSKTESALINKLKKIPFIPLSDGSYGAVDEGTIWLQAGAFHTASDGEFGLGSFPDLCTKLRTVSPALFGTDIGSVDHSLGMLEKIGVQKLTAHEIMKLHVLPALTNDRIMICGKKLLTEYLSFVMIHLQSSCTNCRIEGSRDVIMSELRGKAVIMTSLGCRRPIEVSIHFSREYGSPIDVNKLISPTDLKWHVLDIAYLKHPATERLPSSRDKWREFFKELGVSDFVHVAQVEKGVADIPPPIFKSIMSDGCLISPDSVVRDWESNELVDLLYSVSLIGDCERSKYLLEALDMLWDDNYGNKSTGYCKMIPNDETKFFKSSFTSSINDFKWVASSMDSELHYPKDLYYDCDTVCSILGVSAPYAVPKVRSVKLLNDIGFKTRVTLDDALTLLRMWRRTAIPFKACVTQMSKFYAFIWNEISCSRQQIMEEFHSGPFIFVPCASGYQHDDIVTGIFLPHGEVYWHDPTSSMAQLKESHHQSSSFIGGADYPLNKTLSNIYPGLHDFFVNECGVQEIPSFRSYLQFLLQLSSVSLPSQAASSVSRVFLKWTEFLKSALASSEDIDYLKECLQKLEYTVLPTVLDKWVSLHPSFGVVCWCDNENLKEEFKHFAGIDFLYFGEHSSSEKEIFQTSVSALFQTLSIPALSEIVTRKAIYYGLADSSFKKSLVNWTLPYAQRYIYNAHPEKYLQLKVDGFKIFTQLQVVVVENLFYQNVIKRCNITSKKRHECCSLLQDNYLYTTSDSDPHSIFIELSHLLLNGIPELPLANFLHMVTTMAESGSTKDQTEFFIVNSQKIPKLPVEESIWSLSSLVAERDEAHKLSFNSTLGNEHIPSNRTRKPQIKSSWPPADWKTAPDINYARANGLRTRAAIPQSNSSLLYNEDDCNNIITQSSNIEYSIEADSAAALMNFSLQGAETLEEQLVHVDHPIDCSFDMAIEPVVIMPSKFGTGEQAVHAFNPIDSVMDMPVEPVLTMSSKPNERDQLSFGTINAQQAIITGRVGEHAAFMYFSGIFGDKTVTWVNQEHETGKPYDITVGDNEKGMEYIEVKATRSARKDWFIISAREWQFAVDMGESFSIAHVVLSGNNAAKVTIFKNPAQLCLQKKLQLVLLMPKEQKEMNVVC